MTDVDGVTSDIAGGDDADTSARIFPCGQCGADFEFGIAVQQLLCPYCGFEQAIDVEDGAEVLEQDLVAALEQQSERRAKPPGTDEVREVPCDACGAQVQFAGTLTSLDCPYCSSPVQLAGVHEATDDVAVDGVLPFLIDERKASGQLAAWIGSRWFLPGDLKKRGVQGSFDGVYLPYWTFDALTSTAWSGERGDHYWVTVGSGDDKRRERRTRWRSVSGQFRRFFDDVLAFGCATLPRKLLLALEPWPISRCQPFRGELLAGRFARTYDVPLDKAFHDAKTRMDRALELEVRQRIGGDDQRVHQVRSRYSGLQYKLLLLPVWLLTYKHGERRFQISINAATGEVQGERPWAVGKIVLLIVAILLAVALVAVASGAFS